MKFVPILLLAITLFLFGCQGDKIDINSPVARMTAITVTRLAAVEYLERNDAVNEIINLNAVVQGLEYDMNMYTYNIQGLQDKIIDEIPDNLSPTEREAIRGLIGVVFVAAMEEFQADYHYQIQPEILDLIKLLFGQAAEVAQLYEKVG